MILKSFGLLLVAGVSGAAMAAPPAKMALSPADKAAAFKAAGAVLQRGKWMLCAEQPDNSGATIEDVRDINGDGRPDAIITEGGTFCYGFVGMGYAIVSKQPTGGWKLINGGGGIPTFLAPRPGSWPDLEIGGPGFCFPVHRWNGKRYALNRFQYEGKACRPNR